VPFDLAALHGQHGFVRSAVTHHHLELRSQHSIENIGIDEDRRSSARGSERRFGREGVLNGLQLGGSPNGRHVRAGGDASDPGELAGFELDASSSKLLIERVCRGKQPENGEELAQCYEAMENCPVEAIGDNGQ
jgi:hypothetical protein